MGYFDKICTTKSITYDIIKFNFNFALAGIIDSEYNIRKQPILIL